MVYILLGEGFEEAEALVCADVLRRGEVDTALVGIGGMMVTGSHGIAVRADLPVEQVQLQEGDGVVLPGGMGGVTSIEGSAPAMALTRQARADGDKWLCAICAAPTLLARAGIIGKGDHAVCYPGMEGLMTDAGVCAEMDKPAVTHGKLITGRGPGAAFDFALAIVAALKGADAAEAVRAGLHYQD